MSLTMKQREAVTKEMALEYKRAGKKQKGAILGTSIELTATAVREWGLPLDFVGRDGWMLALGKHLGSWCSRGQLLARVLLTKPRLTGVVFRLLWQLAVTSCCEQASYVLLRVRRGAACQLLRNCSFNL